MTSAATETPDPPALHDVSDECSVAIFDPDRCSGDRGCWIQMDRDHTLSAEDWR